MFVGILYKLGQAWILRNKPYLKQNFTPTYLTF